MSSPWAELLQEEEGFSLARHLQSSARMLRGGENDLHYLVTGAPGRGKSTIARIVGGELARLNDVGFSMRPVDPEGEGGNVVYPGQLYKNVIGGMSYLQLCEPIMVDEAGKTTNSRNSSVREQKALMEFVDMARYLGHPFEWITKHRKRIDINIRSNRAIFEINVLGKPQYDADGHFIIAKGFYDFYHHERFGDMRPFEETSWWKKDGSSTFPDLKDDPQTPEYDYYKRIFTPMAALGWEAPWKEFPYKPGAKVPKIAAMLEAIGEEVPDADEPKERKSRPETDENGEDSWR